MNPGRTALVITDLQMLQPDLEKRKLLGKDSQEMDIIILDYLSQTIYVIEVKTTLNKDSLQKVKEQLPNYKKFFDEWFGSDICELWKFKSFAYCKDVEPGVRFCSECRGFILHGKEELLKALTDGNISHSIGNFSFS